MLILWNEEECEMDPFIAVYLMSNTLITLGIERFMGAYFDKQRGHVSILIFSYFTFLTLTSLMFLYIGAPIISLLVNIVLIFLISFNYESRMIKRVVSVVSILFFLGVSEALVSLLTETAFVSIVERAELGGIYGFVIIGLLAYLAGSLFRKFKNLRRDIMALPLFWVSVITIPVLSSFAAYVIVFSFGLPQNIVILALSAIFAINLLAFYMQDYLAKSYEDALKTKLLSQENELYLSQCQVMHESVNNIKAFRHDYKIHLATIKGFAAKNQAGDVVGYLDNLLCEIEGGEVYSDTGNIAFDSVINYKLKDIQSDNIRLDMEINIPPTINIEIVDIVTILGNLLANALDALVHVSDKWIRLRVNFDKGILYIKVENPFDGIIKSIKEKDTQEETLVSRKSGSAHGYGLKNTQKAAKKYNGQLKITHTDNIFSVGTMLYLS
jgi:sensor histidine kinase YesM